jgi:hypothetical protein
MHKSILFTFGLLASSLVMLATMPLLNNNTVAMAQGYYDNYYGDSSNSYSQYPTDDKKYECRTGPFEGFFVSSVEFCFKDRKSPSPPVPPTPVNNNNNNSTLLNTFNCINNNNINFNEADTNNLSSSSGAQQQPQNNNGAQQGLNGGSGSSNSSSLGQIDLNKTVVNLCVINNTNNIQNGGGGNTSQPDSCEECFTENLSQEQVTSLLVFAGLNELNNLCDILASTPNGENETENLIFTLTQVQPILTSGQSIAILLCLDDLGLIEFPLPP